ncbi:hypothetical protein ACTXT7_010928, partial [Hymenolepis weldensis]
PNIFYERLILTEPSIILIYTLAAYYITKTLFEICSPKLKCKLVAYFHENVGEIMNVVNPLWQILSSHASFISSLFMGTASLLLTGGSVVLNFSFSFLIFLSTLFYLLAASEQTYLPFDFIVSLTPQRGEASPVVLFFYASVEGAVASVVVTTLKRTIFYGMYTVLTHTLFGLDIVVLPSSKLALLKCVGLQESHLTLNKQGFLPIQGPPEFTQVIATILGAIPLMGTYWAVLPGVVELWCLHDSCWLALLLLLLHLLPWYFLDTALYSEIKGGHEIKAHRCVGLCNASVSSEAPSVCVIIDKISSIVGRGCVYRFIGCPFNFPVLPSPLLVVISIPDYAHACFLRHLTSLDSKRICKLIIDFHSPPLCDDSPQMLWFHLPSLLLCFTLRSFSLSRICTVTLQ